MQGCKVSPWSLFWSPAISAWDRHRIYASCGSCHTGGITKTNPNVGLDTEALSLATPYRNSVAGLVEYMKNPTTFDGLESIAEIHPSVASADIFPKMRSLSEDDLFAIAGHILLQPKVISEKWGGGKIYY